MSDIAEDARRALKQLRSDDAPRPAAPSPDASALANATPAADPLLGLTTAPSEGPPAVQPALRPIPEPPASFEGALQQATERAATIPAADPQVQSELGLTKPPSDGLDPNILAAARAAVAAADGANAGAATPSGATPTVTPSAGQQPAPAASGTTTNVPASAPASPAASLQPVVIDLRDPNVRVRTADGREISGKEAEGEMMLKQKFSQQQHELLQQKRQIEAQRAFLDQASSDPLVATYLQAVRAGATREQALEAGRVAAGLTAQQAATQIAQFQGAAAALPANAQLQAPSSDDPEYERKMAEFIAMKTRSEVLAELRPILETVAGPRMTDEQRREQVAQQAQLQAVRQHNDDLMAAYVEPYVPDGLTSEQTKYLVNYVIEVGHQEGLPTKEYDRTKFSVGDAKLLQMKAFPNGELPAQVRAQLDAIGRGQYGGVVPPNVAPASGGYAQPGYAPAGYPGVSQTAAPQMPAAAAPPVDARGLLQQELLQKQRDIVALQQQLGLAPPPAPQQPLPDAGPNTAALPNPTSALTGVPTKERISRELGSLARL